MASTKAPVVPLAGFSSDLNDFVVSPIVITDSLGNPVTNFYYGSNYFFRITFMETAALQFAYYHDSVTGMDYLTYQLPPQIKVLQSTVDNSPYPILGESTTPGGPRPIIGYYSIDINGLIKVHFDNVDKYGNPALVWDEDLQQYVLVNFIDYYSDATFTLDIAAQFQQIGSDQEIDFGNNVIITVTVEGPRPGTLAIAKTATVDAIASRTVTFTVTITAQDGPVHDITLNDFAWPGYPDWIKRGVFSNMTVTVRNGAPYTPPEFPSLQGQLFGNGFNLAFPGVTLNPGEQILVQFTLDVANLINEWVAANPSTAGNYNFDITLYNRAVAQGLDENNVPTPAVTANQSARLLRRFLQKAGSQDLAYDYTAKWIEWSVGDGLTLLNGSTIIDTLTGLLFGGNNTMPNGINGAYVTFLDPTGTPIASWYIPVAAGAAGFSFTVPAPNEIVVTGLRGDGVFVQGRGVHAIDNTLPYGPIVTITVANFWTTVADLSDFDNSPSNTYHNTITVDINGDHPSYTADVVINKPGGSPTITKTGAFGGTGGQVEYIEWTIVFYVPGLAYNQPVYLTDSFFTNIYGFGGDPPTAFRRFDVLNVPENLVVTVYSAALGERTLIRNANYTLLDQVNNNGYTIGTGGWYLYFIGDTTGIPFANLAANSLWPFQDNTWLTITYRISLDAPVRSGTDVMTLREALQWNKGGGFIDASNWVYGYNPITPPPFQYVYTSASLRWALRKTGTVNGNTITYLVEIRTETFTLADLFTDVFDPRLEYVPFSFRIWKSDASTTYYGPYQLVGGVFTDLLSESITGNTMSFDFLHMYRVNWGPDGAVYYPNPPLLSETPPAVISYFIEFKMKLRDDLPPGQYTVTNTALINGFDNSWPADIGTKVVNKTMTAASNIATVTIVINPEELTLAGTAGRYTVTDTLSDTLALYLSTIVAEAWEGGVWVRHELTNSASGDLWTYTVTGANQISFVVPDSTMLQLTYQALIRGDVGDTVAIGNQVLVAGQYSDSAEEVFFITDTSASASGTRTNLAVIKYNAAQPELLLNGAIFALYIGIAYPGWDTVKVPSGIDRVITVGTMNFYYLANATSANNGRLVFNNPWLTPTHRAIYALVELRQPVGYAPPTEPVTLFSYTVPTEAQKTALGARQNDVQQISDVISAPNTPLANVAATVNGYKVVVGENPPDKIFTFRLTQVADAAGTPLANPYTDTTTTVGQGPFGFSLMNLTPGTTYYFKITEDVDPADPDWVYDPNAVTGRIVIVTVAADGTATVTYPGGGVQVTFTNTLATALGSITIIKRLAPDTITDLAITGQVFNLTLSGTKIGDPTTTLPPQSASVMAGGTLTFNHLPLDYSYMINELTPISTAAWQYRDTVVTGAGNSIIGTPIILDPANPNMNLDLTNVYVASLGESADLAIVKTGDQTTVQAGSTLTYTLTAINNGPNDAQNVAITDAIPAALTGAEFSIDNGVTWLPWTGSYVVGTLLNGASFIVQIRSTVSATASGNITNTAVITSTTPDPDTTNNSSTKVTPVNVLADLAVTKVGDQTNVDPGEMLIYTITVANHGPHDAENVTVTDAIPNVLTGVEYSADNGVTWLPWSGSYSLGTLLNGASFALLIKGLVSDLASGTIINTAVVTSTTPDPNLSNNTDTNVTIVTVEETAADLRLAKLVDQSAAHQGSKLTYSIIVANNGPDDANNVTITDAIPAVLTGPEFSINNGATWLPWTGSYALGTLANGASFKLLIRGTVSSTATGNIINTAVVSSTTPDPDLTNNSDTKVTPIAIATDLAIIKYGPQTSVPIGGIITYTITVLNNGPNDAQNVNVTDAIPPVLTGAEFSTDGGVIWLPWTGSYALGTLLNGASFNLLIRSTVSAGASGVITNTAVVSSTTPDPNLRNNVDTNITNVTPVVAAADLAITKVSDQTVVLPGGTLLYTITVVNNGPDEAHNVTVTDTIPAQLTGVEFTVNGGANWLPWTGSYALGTLLSGASVRLVIRGTVSETAGGDIINTATVSSTTPDPDLSNNTSTNRVPVNNGADLSVVKTACPLSAAPCGRITYTIVISNAGPNEAVNVTLTDQLPEKLCKGQYSFDGRRWCQWCAWNSIIPLGNLSAGASKTILIRGIVRRCAAGNLVNTATVSAATPDPNLNNNQFTVTTPIRNCRR